MNKLEFFILLNILAIIYSILNYLELIRYVNIRVNSNNYFLKKFRKMKKYSKVERIVLIIDTDVKRINKLKPCINSLLDQTIRVDEIALNLKDGDLEKVDPILHKILNVYEVENFDNKICQNIIPTLYRENDNDTIIILLKDNIIYPKNFILHMVEKSVKNPHNVIKSNIENVFLFKPEFFSIKSLDDVCNEKWLQNNLRNNISNIKKQRFYKF